MFDGNDAESSGGAFSVTDGQIYKWWVCFLLFTDLYSSFHLKRKIYRYVPGEFLGVRVACTI